MSKFPLVSVIMPLYNDEVYLEDAIVSILNQTFGNFEFLIIDDHSTDGSEEIIAKFTDSRIKYYKGDTNRGPAFRRNQGIDLARGKYIALMDGDDISVPDRFEISIAELEKDDDLGIIGGYAQLFSEDKILEIRTYPGDHDSILAQLFFKGAFCNPSVMLNKAILDRHSIRYDEKLLLAEDYYLWFQLLRVSKGKNINKVLVNYRVSSSQITRTHLKEKAKCLGEVHARMVRDVSENLLVPDDRFFHLESNWPDELLYYKNAHLWFEKFILENRKSGVFPKNEIEKEIFLYLYYKLRVSKLINNKHAINIYKSLMEKVGASYYKLYIKILFVYFAKKLYRKSF